MNPCARVVLPGVVLTDIRHFMLIAFQYFDNVQQPRNIFLIRDVVMHKTHKHKHQCDENRNAEKRVQNASHLRRTEGLRQPLQRRDDTVMLLGMLGWDKYDGKVEFITELFPSSGTGQVNAVFPLPA